jgi:hypothetical protein
MFSKNRISRSNILILILSTIILITFLSCDNDPKEIEPGLITEFQRYFPLRLGDLWTMVDAESEIELHYDVISIDTTLSYVTALFQVEIVEQDTVRELHDKYYRWFGDELLYSKVPNFFDEDNFSRETRLSVPLSVGSSWVGRILQQGESIERVDYSVLSVTDTVIVPLDTFFDVLKIQEIYFIHPAGEESTNYKTIYYYAKDYGIIKRVWNIDGNEIGESNFEMTDFIRGTEETFPGF